MDGFPVYDKKGRKVGVVPYEEGWLGTVREGLYVCTFIPDSECSDNLRANRQEYKDSKK